MRYANNFNPEWGYLAPAPGFTRTARIALVAAAVGASAGGAVVFSLLEGPPAAETSVAARTLVQPADAGVSAAQAAQAHPQAGPALQPPVLQPQVQTRSQPEMRTSDMRTVVHRPVLQ